MTTYIILKKNVTLPPTSEPTENVFNCLPVPIQPSTPITTIFSCREPTLDPPDLPVRSTFCFPESTMKYKSRLEIRQLREQWDTFERIENFNSIVLNKLAQTVPPEASSGTSTPAFYQFQSSAEKTAYNLGQSAHTVTYPDETDFLVPYASKPIPYISTVISTIVGYKYVYVSTTTSTFCSNILPTAPKLDSDIILRNRNGLNLYVRVSTQIGQYPKSPYKFSSNSEYLLYNEYKKILC
jgi:hypothetical protein